VFVTIANPVRMFLWRGQAPIRPRGSNTSASAMTRRPSRAARQGPYGAGGMRESTRSAAQQVACRNGDLRAVRPPAAGARRVPHDRA